MIRAPVSLAGLVACISLLACGPDLPPAGPRDAGAVDAPPLECNGGTTHCGSACVDTTTSDAHCGACNAACGAGEACVAGTCACAAGFTACGDACVDTTRDEQHCGGCDQPCAAPDSCNAGTCGTCGSGVSLAHDVQPIFTARCASTPCHGGARPARDVALDASRIHASVVGVASSCAGTLLVAPGEPDASYLVHKIEGTHACGGQRMPSGAGTLTASEQDTIREWICGGARDD